MRDQREVAMNEEDAMEQAMRASMEPQTERDGEEIVDSIERDADES